VAEFHDTIFRNVEEEAIALFIKPDPEKAVVSDCGNFVCTGAWNTYFTFKGVTFYSQVPSFASD
jgi:hypothetical protein